MPPHNILNFATIRWLEQHHNKKLLHQAALDPLKILNLSSMFTHMDYDGNGTIELDEIQIALETISYNALKAQEILAKFELMDADGSGAIDFEEFVAVMTSDLQGRDFFNLKDEQDQGIQHQAFYEFATTYRREMLLEIIEYVPCKSERARANCKSERQERTARANCKSEASAPHSHDACPAPYSHSRLAGDAGTSSRRITRRPGQTMKARTRNRPKE